MTRERSAARRADVGSHVRTLALLADAYIAGLRSGTDRRRGGRNEARLPRGAALVSAAVEDLLSRLEHVEEERLRLDGALSRPPRSRRELERSRGRRGPGVAPCHAGCETESIVAELGLEISDLFERQENGSGGQTIRRGRRPRGRPRPSSRQTSRGTRSRCSATGRLSNGSSSSVAGPGRRSSGSGSVSTVPVSCFPTGTRQGRLSGSAGMRRTRTPATACRSCSPQPARPASSSLRLRRSPGPPSWFSSSRGSPTRSARPRSASQRSACPVSPPGGRSGRRASPAGRSLSASIATSRAGKRPGTSRATSPPPAPAR